jgi:hypothetical protein
MNCQVLALPRFLRTALLSSSPSAGVMCFMLLIILSESTAYEADHVGSAESYNKPTIT